MRQTIKTAIAEDYSPIRKPGKSFLTRHFVMTPALLTVSLIYSSSSKKAIASGPEGSMRVINTLQDGIRMVWPYTEEHKLARELYEIYLSGDLKPWDEPRQVLEGALERFKAKGKVKGRKSAGQGRGKRKSRPAQART